MRRNAGHPRRLNGGSDRAMITNKEECPMDFLTGAAYWGIAVLVIVNAFIVMKMKVDVGEETGHEKDQSKCQPGI